MTKAFRDLSRREHESYFIFVVDGQHVHCYNKVVTSSSTRSVPIEEFGPMEFFLMATIEKAGLNSMYRLQQLAGLQPGGIRPTLARLERNGLLVRERGSKRGRKELKLSEQGQHVLEEHWDAAIDRSYLDIESVLRAACCALLMNEAERACEYLFGQAEVRHRWAEERKQEARKYPNSDTDPLTIYAWLKNQCDAARKNAESETLFAISEQLKARFGITYSDLEHAPDPRQKGGHMPRLR